MGMKVYIGKDGVAKSVKAIYVGVNGVAKCIMRPSGIYKYNESIEPLCNGRDGLAAATVRNYALFAGGRAVDAKTGSYTPYSSVDAYNASLTRSTPTGLRDKKTHLAATTFGNYALFAGGCDDGASITYSSVDAYDSALVRSITTALSAARYYLAAATVGNYALFAGGEKDNNYYSSINAYNTSMTRSAPTDLMKARSRLAAATFGNYALFAGGYIFSRSSHSTTYCPTVDAYNASLTRSTPTGLSVARYDLAAATVGNYALFAGGSGKKLNYSTIDVYDSTLVRSNPVNLSTDRYDPVGITINGKYALFFGGCAGRIDADVYDIFLVRTSVAGIDNALTDTDGAIVGDYILFAGGSYLADNDDGSKIITVYTDKVNAYMYDL